MLSSFPDEMGTMQNQLSKFKESASDVHSLRAHVKSISKILERKVVIYVIECFFLPSPWREKNKISTVEVLTLTFPSIICIGR